MLSNNSNMKNRCLISTLELLFTTLLITVFINFVRQKLEHMNFPESGCSKEWHLSQDVRSTQQLAFFFQDQHGHLRHLVAGGYFVEYRVSDIVFNFGQALVKIVGQQSNQQKGKITLFGVAGQMKNSVLVYTRYVQWAIRSFLAELDHFLGVLIPQGIVQK